MSNDTAELSNKAYDVIVIGSGMGGLTTASLLAQVGKKRVLVIERHAKLGGFTHCFQRHHYEWDIGLHYVGEMNEGTMARRMMDLVTRKQVAWHPMGNTYDRFLFPGETFDVPVGVDAFRARLIERFPAEKDLIVQYFKDIASMQGWVGMWYTAKQYPRFVQKLMTHFGSRMAGMTTAEYMTRFKDPLLRAILTAQWPNFGTPPKHSSFAQHATVTGHFFDGGFYPVGGSKAIAREAAAAIEAQGGACLVSHEVSEIIVRKGRAVGVKVQRKGKTLEFFAKQIVSGAGVHTTFEKLVPPGECAQEKAQVRRLVPGTSAIILFVGLHDDPRRHGFDDANYWLYSQVDHDTEAAAARADDPHPVDGGFVSFGSLRNPGQTPHTAQVITFGGADAWSPYAGSRWMRRGEDYADVKRKLTEKLLDFVEARMPGFRQLVSYVELSTPLTVEHFANHDQGMIYGQLSNPDRLFRDSWSVGTSLPGLFLTGADVGSPGVDGAMMAGVMTAARLLGPLGMPRLMARAYARQ